MQNMIHRPRRLRSNSSIRDLSQETRLHPSDFIYPIFVESGSGKQTPIQSLPGISRYTLDLLLEHLETVVAAGIRGVALFPKIDEDLKDPRGSESTNPNGLVPRTVQEIKKRFPQLLVFTDIALDPFNSDCHDGLVQNGQILNDETIEILCQMAIVHAQAGADFVSPSDMMDGRIGAIREALDQEGYSHVGIMAYTAKYASALYGPFREALDSAPKAGDKKTYQMNPANAIEAERELHLDLSEGADLVIVKPATFYLDIIQRLSTQSSVPVVAYHVSGEYAMVHASAQMGWCQLEPTMMEALLSIKRAGAQIIITYYALEASRILRQEA